MRAPALRIAHKLGLVALGLVLPVAYLLWALVAQQNIAIDFSGKERAGTLYLRGLWPVQHELALAALHGDAPDKTAVSERVQRLEREYGAGMDSAELSARLLSELATADTAATLTQARATMRDLVARVGDRSNLILDPDLDSYYAMDLTLIKLPDLIDRLVGMAGRNAAVWADGRFEGEERAGFFAAYGGLSALLAGIDASVASAYGGNADGSLKANLDRSYRALGAAARTFVSAIQDGPVPAADVDATLAAAAGFYDTASAELERLIDRRVAARRAEQITTMVITGVYFLGSIALVLAVVRLTEIRGLPRITATMSRLAPAGTLNVGVDEIGDMVRACEEVERFRRDVSANGEGQHRAA